MDKHTAHSLDELGISKEDLEITPWDASEFLDSPEMIEAYIREAFATDDAQVITRALGDVAKAIGMTEIARKSGLNRQNLYRALSGEGAPRLDTLLGVLGALDLRLTTEAKTTAPA